MVERASVRRVMVAHPDLTIDGLRRCFGKANDFGYSNLDAFDKARNCLLDDRHLHQITTAYRLIWHFPIPRKVYSYGLKHQLERAGHEFALAGYITNGCAIVGAVLAGYEIVRLRDCQNCEFKRKPD